MKTPKTREDLQVLIDSKIEESFRLEYKDPRSLNSSEEIAKDISAMANSEGGLIIYGIKEFDEKSKKHLQEKIAPINRSEFSRETLDQIINSNISPKINGIKIEPIFLGEDEVVYVAEVPQSDTAHQNTQSRKYHKRRNFTTEAMLDYEIRDVMNRAKHPVMEMIFEIMLIEEEYRIESPDWLAKPKYEKVKNRYLNLKPLNQGTSYAQYVNYFIELPENILHNSESKNLEKLHFDYVKYYGDNTFRDVIDIKAGLNGDFIRKYGSSRFDPILPQLCGRSEKILLSDHINFDDREIRWKIHADNAPVKTGSISLNKINIVDKNEAI
jgi:hypothetical protein